MAVKRIAMHRGLTTDVADLDAPEGGMIQADNVIIHRPGIIQQRPGFGDVTGVAARTTDFRPIRFAAFTAPSTPIVVAQSFDSPDYRLERLSANTVYATLNCTPPTYQGVSCAMEARGSLYLTTATGIRKLQPAGTYTRAGAWTTYQAPEASLINLTAGGHPASEVAIESDSSVAYRYVYRRTDAQGYVIRSAPSTRQIVRVASSYTTGAFVELGNFFIPPQAIAGDVVELYRTRNSGAATADPGEDYYLCGEYVLTSADISSASVATIISDRLADDLLGASLYTSLSQLGAIESKEIPPQADVLAWWGNVAWAGATTERRSLAVQLKYVARGADFAGQGLCTVEGTSAGGTGTMTLTGVSLSADEWTCLAAGMWIADTGTTGSSGRIPLNAKIVSFDVGATTITIDQVIAGTGAFFAGDIVTVNSHDHKCTPFALSFSQNRFTLSDDADPAVRAYETSLNMARVINVYGNGISGWPVALKDELASGGDGEFLIVDSHPENESLTIQCASRGSAFSPDITAQVSAPTTARPGRIAWSAPDEPEAWPPANYAIVGDGNARIMALTPLDEALLVWKTDGLYRITGLAPSSWVVDEMSATPGSPLRLLAPQCVCVLGQAAYAWTDRGVVEVTAGGVSRVISGPIANVLREYQLLLPRDSSDHRRGFWMHAHRRLGLVVLGLATSGTQEKASFQYVWSQATGAWMRWTRSDRCWLYDIVEDRMLVSPDVSAWAALYERPSDVPYDHSIASLTSLAVSGFGGYVPKACDLVRFRDLGVEGGPADPYRELASVATSGGDYVFTYADGTTSASDTGSIPRWDWVQGWASACQWQAQHLAGNSQRWQEIHAHFGSRDSSYLDAIPVYIGGATELDPAAATVEASLDIEDTNGSIVRVGVPRQVVRGQRLYPYVRVCAAGVYFELEHVYLHHTDNSRRVKR